MTERELERRAKHKLAVLKHVEKVSGSVSATCRYYDISRNCYYKWLKRYEEEGFEGLKTDPAPHTTHRRPPRPRSSRRSCGWRQRYHFGQARSRCTWSGTTRSRSAPPASGGSCTTPA